MTIQSIARSWGGVRAPALRHRTALASLCAGALLLGSASGAFAAKHKPIDVVIAEEPEDHVDEHIGNGGGIEWEFATTGITKINGGAGLGGQTTAAGSASSVAGAKGEVLCTKAKVSGFPLIKITKDLPWTNWLKGKYNKNISTIEVVTAPIPYTDDEHLSAAVGATDAFYKAVLARCTVVADFKADPAQGNGKIPHVCLAKGSDVLAQLGETWEWCAEDIDKTNLGMLLVLPTADKALSQPIFASQNTQVNAEVALTKVATKKLLHLFGNANLVKEAYGHFVDQAFVGVGKTPIKKGQLILRAYSLVADLLTYSEKLEDAGGGHWVEKEAAQAGVSRKNNFDVYLKTKFDNGELDDKPTAGQVLEWATAACTWMRGKLHNPGWLSEDCKVITYFKVPKEVGPGFDYLAADPINLLSDGHWLGVNPISPAKPCSPIQGKDRVVVEVRLVTPTTTNASLKWDGAKLTWVNLGLYKAEMAKTEAE